MYFLMTNSNLSKAIKLSYLDFDFFDLEDKIKNDLNDCLKDLNLNLTDQSKENLIYDLLSNLDETLGNLNLDGVLETIDNFYINSDFYGYFKEILKEN